MVDTDETATKLLEHLNREKSGRVTFMPLNRLRVKPVDYPASSDAIPMVKRLRFDPQLEVAFQQAFGKILICRSLEVASDFAKTHGLNCVTLEGDQVNRKGALTGGFVDSGKSRLDAIKQIKKLRKDLQAAEADLDKIHQETESQFSFLSDVF